MKLHPTRLQIYLFAALAALGLAAAFVPELDLIWKIGIAAIGGLSVVDCLLTRQPPTIRIERKLAHNMPVGVWSKIGLEISNLGSQSVQLLIHDHHPINFDAESIPQSTAVPKQAIARLSYRVRPRVRGDGVFPGLDVVASSPFNLWQRKRFYNLEDKVMVFPNFREISHYALLATDNRLSQIGVKRKQKRGEGNDFHQLREYRAGDAMRQIDWKATSRYRKLISKEYQDERDQQIVFMLDCGRRMRHAEEGRVHLDQALNAMLLLSYVAARQGDAVGFMAFAGERRWFPPRKSADVVQHLLKQTYDIQSSTEAADYLGAASQLMQLQGRRALVVMMTNTRDEDHDTLVPAIQLLRSRHLVVLADLREEILDEVLRKKVQDFDSALSFNSVNMYMDSRRRNHEALHHQGALTLDLLAPQLPVALVNEYLMIKASGAL